MRSSSHPAIGADTPIASESAAVIQETRAWLQPKAFSSSQKDRRGVITAAPEEEQRDEEADRFNPRLALPLFHGCLRNEMCGRIINAAPDQVRIGVELVDAG